MVTNTTAVVQCILLMMTVVVVECSEMYLTCHRPATTTSGSKSSLRSPKYLRMQEKVARNVPCDLSTTTYCNLPGDHYPWHSVRRFVSENQGLIRRMYGEVRQLSVLRMELEDDVIMSNSIEQEEQPRGAAPEASSSSNKQSSSSEAIEIVASPAVAATPEVSAGGINNKSSSGAAAADDQEESSSAEGGSSSVMMTTVSSDPGALLEELQETTTTVGAAGGEEEQQQQQVATETTMTMMTSSSASVPQESITASPVLNLSGLTTTEEEAAAAVAQDDDSFTVPQEEEVTADAVKRNSAGGGGGGPFSSSSSGESGNKPVEQEQLKAVNACPVKEEVVAPYWANNTRGELLALLNLYPFEQYIHYEKCNAEFKQMFCRDGCRCEQQYRLHRLLAFDPTNECRGIFSDWFRFPSCCVCKCYLNEAQLAVHYRADVSIPAAASSRSPRRLSRWGIGGGGVNQFTSAGGRQEEEDQQLMFDEDEDEEEFDFYEDTPDVDGVAVPNGGIDGGDGISGRGAGAGFMYHHQLLLQAPRRRRK